MTLIYISQEWKRHAYVNTKKTFHEVGKLLMYRCSWQLCRFRS